jgi:hypothetical protein
MARNLVYASPDEKTRLYGGLDWRLLSVEGNVTSELRSLAKGLSASFAAMAVGTEAEESTVKGKSVSIHRVAAGYFTSADNTKPPAGAHSLAAAFARWTHEHPQALLNVRLADGRYAVVVVIKGHPVVDKIEDNAGAAMELGREYQKNSEISIFSDDVVLYPDAVEHQELLERISEWVSKETAIRSIPVDLVKLGTTLVVVAVLAGGWVAWSKWDAEQKRLAAIEKQRAEDPVPKYLEALAAAKPNVGIDRKSIVEAIDFAYQIPTAPEGWNAGRVACIQGSGCEAVFQRTTGTFAGLEVAVPLLKMSAAGAINLNEARMSWKQELGTAALDPGMQMPDLGTFIQGPEASKLQDWLVAGLTIQVSPQQLWPQVPEVPPGFRHPDALAIGKFEIDGIGLPQMREVVQKAPPNVYWTAWAIDLGDAKQEPLSRAKGRLTGNYYVKNN